MSSSKISRRRPPPLPLADQALFRGIVREELLRGVPDFALRQCTDDFVESLLRRVMSHVNAAAQSPKERREAGARLRNALESLGEEVQAMLQDRLYAWSQHV